VTTILDAGALIALDHNDRSMWVRLKGLHLAGEQPVTHGGVVGQVWRGGPRQARLAMTIAPRWHCTIAGASTRTKQTGLRTLTSVRRMASSTG
jgi:hypothetical protein